MPEKGVFYKNRSMLYRRAFRASWGILVRQAGVRRAAEELHCSTWPLGTPPTGWLPAIGRRMPAQVKADQHLPMYNECFLPSLRVRVPWSCGAG
jgi:hypothetical protein